MVGRNRGKHRAIRRLRKMPRVLVVALTLGMIGLFTSVAIALVSDSGTYDITVPNKNTSGGPLALTPSGGSVEYIGSSADNQASGTGLFDPFVRLQGAPTEKGYNTDGAVEFDTKTGTWTHAIKVNAIPIVDCDGTGSGTATCWELFVDINDSNNAKRISLNVVEIWFTDSATLTGYVDPTGFPAGATKEYEFNGDILINDVNQGSGRGDLRYLVPTEGHTWDANTYFVLYSKWGTTAGTAGNFGTGGYSSEGGFEEWKVRKTPNVSIVKMADADSVNAGTDIGFTITVTNSGVADATGVTITDDLPGGTGTTPVHWTESPDNPDCTISGSDGSQVLSCGPVTLAAGGGSLSVHLIASTTADNCGQYDNTATFTSDNAGTGSDDASVTVLCGALQITKTAKHAGAGNADLSGTFTVVDAAGSSHDVEVVDGSGCADGIAIGMTQSITEDPADFPGYSVPDIANVAVVAGTCSNGTLGSGGVNVDVENTPLTDIAWTVDSQVAGGTSTVVNCWLGEIDATPDFTTTVEDGTHTFEDLFPTDPDVTLTCQFIVDP